MASADRFVLNIKGVGCHGSSPEKGVDPVTIVSNIVLALQTVIAVSYTHLDVYKRQV